MTTAAPSVRAPVWRHLVLSSFWFGSAFHWAVLLLLLIPADVRRLVGEQDKATALGFMIGSLALIPLLLPPLLGVLSDRLGRRLAFVGVGVAVDLAGLALMFVAPTYWAYFLGYLIVQVGNNLATGPYMALIPDVVPERERGASSGVMACLQVTGQLAGFAAVFALSGNRTAQFAVIALMLVISALVTLLGTREPPRRPRPEGARLSWRVYLEPRYRDFRWVFATRALWEFGRACVQPFLLYYLTDVIVTFRVGSVRLADETQALALLLGVIAIMGAVTALLGGRLSDRTGRKRVVYVAGGLMTLAVCSFALADSFAVVLTSGVLFGIGYGAFLSVDWALGASVLPDPSGHARDMGVWHVAMVLPQLFDGLTGRLLDATNAVTPGAGYLLMFGVAAVMFLLATVLVSRVRGTA